MKTFIITYISAIDNKTECKEYVKSKDSGVAVNKFKALYPKLKIIKIEEV